MSLARFICVALVFSAENSRAQDAQETSACPLCEAVAQRDISETQRLLDAGADVNMRDDKDIAPFIYATVDVRLRGAKRHYCLDGRKWEDPVLQEWQLDPRQVEIIEMLLEYGADINTNAKEGRRDTPLYHAVWDSTQSGDYTVLDLLLARGAAPSPHETDNPLSYALGDCNYIAAMKLLWHGASIDRYTLLGIVVGVLFAIDSTMKNILRIIGISEFGFLPSGI